MYNSDKLDQKHNLNGNRGFEVGSKGEMVKTLNPKADINIYTLWQKGKSF